MSDLSPDEQSYLDALWPLPEFTLGQLVTRMEKRFGCRYTEEQLRDAAQQNDVVTIPAPVTSVVTWRPKAVVRKPRVNLGTQCTHPVKPGTYHTPGGYRIGPRGTLAAIATEEALKVPPARRKRGAHG